MSGWRRSFAALTTVLPPSKIFYSAGFLQVLEYFGYFF
tara:strand:- start:244 stop:357 length:114 start_codon:yes stop_codon:yes gene_type:complete